LSFSRSSVLKGPAPALATIASRSLSSISILLGR
jgi:hypothetical protein